MALRTKAVAAAMTMSLAAWACAQGMERQFPPLAKPCAGTGHGLPNQAVARVDGRDVGLSPALVIRDASNRSVVSSQLPQAFSGMCIFGPGGQLEKLWLLGADPARAAAARGGR